MFAGSLLDGLTLRHCGGTLSPIKLMPMSPPTSIICLKQVYDLCWAAFIAVLGPMQPTDSGQTYLELIHSLACLS